MHRRRVPTGFRRRYHGQMTIGLALGGLGRIAWIAGLLAVGLALAVAWAALRPNRSVVDPRLGLRHRAIVSDGVHNSNTDMIEWQGQLLLVHDARPYHLGTPESRLVVRRSSDGHDWDTLATLRVEGKDIRDPKFAIIGGRLFLYALPNSSTYATPEGTVLATSDDAVHWSAFAPVGPPGWLFWRPKSPDGGRTWYVSAYWHEHGESILLRSTDGIEWARVSRIYRGEANDETAIEFLPDGRLLATARLEVTADAILGNADAGTAIAVAQPPFEEWEVTRVSTNRLDGPRLFSHEGRVYAVARWQPGPYGPLTRMASALARKRTALYRIEPDRLVWLSDLPSAGDTSYAGVVRRGDEFHVDYYTSRIDRDYPWALGMFLASDIRMARFSAAALSLLSNATP